MTRQRHSLATLRLVLFLCGGLALGYSAFVLGRAYFYQRTAEREMGREQAVPRILAPPRPIADGMPLAHFEIPRLKMNTIVIEGDTDEDLKLGAGHIPGTALPGAIGNVGIAGHRDTVFRPLRNIRPGDLITLTSTGTAYQYRVESTEIVAPQRSDLLNPTQDHRLTLVTCFPFYYVGSAPKRFIVHAREIEEDRWVSVGQ